MGNFFLSKTPIFLQASKGFLQSGDLRGVEVFLTDFLRDQLGISNTVVKRKIFEDIEQRVYIFSLFFVEGLFFVSAQGKLWNFIGRVD